MRSSYRTPPTLIQAVILYHAQTPTLGVEIRDEVEPLALASNLQGSGWYQIISRCISAGWLSKKERDGRSVYTTTKQGKEALALAVRAAKVIVKKKAA